MIDPTAACARGRAWPSRSRTQGAAFASGKGKPEDADMRSATCAIRVRGVVGSLILDGLEHSSDQKLRVAWVLDTRLCLPLAKLELPWLVKRTQLSRGDQGFVHGAHPAAEDRVDGRPEGHGLAIH